MSRFRRTLLVASTALLLLAGAASPATADRGGDRRSGYTFAVIGDVPYGAPAAAAFPSVVDRINADRDLELVAHLGDIKSGSTLCTDEYFDFIRGQFDRFTEPLVYTPGDNEWTDCHRPNNGAYNPLERLDTIRATFFDRPGRTLGDRERIRSQARYGYPENVQWSESGVTFAAVHIVGSNNGMAPWTGNTTATPEQTAEVLGRTAAAIEGIHDAFDAARRDRSRAVMIMTQADMFDPTVTSPTYANYYAFTPIVEALIIEASHFHGPVYLVNGDSHVYNVDRPLAAGSTWLALYGVDGSANNLTRITVDGAADADNYLKFVVSRRGAVSWQQVPFTS
jgi:hypothetical protein